MKALSITKLGILVTLSIGLLIWGVNFLQGNNLFKAENEYYAIYEKVDGLVETSPVMISGYKVGQVRDIAFLPDNSGRLLVRFVINEKYSIQKNTKAELYSSDIMGTKAIKLIHGKSNEKHSPGDTLIANIEGDLIDEVSMTMLPLKVKAESMLSSIDSVLIVVKYIFNKNAQENLSKSFANINKTIINLERTTGQLNEVVSQERDKLAVIMSNLSAITSNFKDNNELITLAINNFAALSDSLAKTEIKETIHNANMTLTQLNEITGRINRGEGSIGELLHNDTLYAHMQNAAYNLNRLLRDLHENPKRYIHFSAFDMGKTIYVDDGKGDKYEKKKRKKRKKNDDDKEN